MSLPYYHTHIHIVHGPNLNLLGIREPSIYGHYPFEHYLSSWRKMYKHILISYFQSNHEGALIDHLQEIGFSSDGIILNAAAYTHTSIALADTVRSIESPVVEVHISDIDRREAYRRYSYLTAPCIAKVSGKGFDGYIEAIDILLDFNKAV